MRIGVVDFLNAYPLWAALETNPGVELVRGVPSFLATELFAGRLDVGLISSVEYLRHPGGYGYHKGLCIAAEREVCSIRLFVREQPQDFATHLKKTRRIYTDIASRSSVAQLQVILDELGLKVALEEISNVENRIPQLTADEALLTIGDTALKNLGRPSYDLQKEYFGIFQRGFVYALWVYRASLAAEADRILEEAYEAFEREKSICLKAATGRFGFTAAFTETYLTQIIQHRLTPARQADLDFFAGRLRPQ